ncbi:hypothetical protein OA406_02130 [Acidimicrobiaceae bacterium]|nr:hypothetical protein [Acidimicrobiaceae bacterium]
MQIDDLNSQNISNEDQILSYEEIEKFPKSFYTHAEAIFHLKEVGIEIKQTRVAEWLGVSRANVSQAIITVLFGLFVTFAWTNIMFIPIATMELSQTLDYGPLMKATLQAALAGVSFGALGFALGAFTGRSSMAWAFGGGLMAFEYLTNSLSGTNDFFQWVDDNISSFGAYGNPYQDGLVAEDMILVIAKIIIFIAIGFIGFRNRSLNLR